MNTWTLQVDDKSLRRLRRIFRLVGRVRASFVARRDALAAELAECGYASIHDTPNGHLIYYRPSNVSVTGWDLCGAVADSAHKPIKNLDLGRRIRAAERRESSRAILEHNLFCQMRDTVADESKRAFTAWLEDK